MSEEKTLPNSFATIETLLSWVQIFKIEAPHQSALDFVDGIALAEILHEIDPVFFGPRWLDGFVQDCGNSWRLKMANLQRVLSRLQDFFLEVTGSAISSSALLPDIRVLAEFQPPSDGAASAQPVIDSVYRFLQLTVGCAVSCSRRQHFIEAILNLETEVQAGVMEAVKLVLERSEERFDNSDERSGQTEAFSEHVGGDDVMALRTQLQAALRSRDELLEKVKCLEIELNTLRQRSESLSGKAAKAMIDADDDVNRNEPSRSGNTGIQHSSVHDENERLRDELERIDAARDEWRQKSELAEHEAATLRARVAELVSSTRETKRLRDELDVAKHAVERLAIAESQIEQLQRKVEQSGSAQRKLRTLEDRLQAVLDENSSLQDQLTRLRAVSKRRGNTTDTSDSGTDKQLLEDDNIGSNLRYDLLQRQFEETTSKLADTREQLMNALAQNRVLVDENLKLRQTAAETTSASYETLPSLQGNRDDGDAGTDHLNLDDTEKDNLILSLKAEIARRKNEALIIEQRYRKYLERARAVVKLVSLTAGSNYRSSPGTADSNVGVSFVASSSSLAQMRAQLRLLAETNSRYLSSSPLQFSVNGTGQQNHSAEAAL